MESISEYRFIPAHAGNRNTRQACRSSWPVHPRARGEQRASERLKSSLPGSSPRTRGTEPVFGPMVEYDRFIPAHAGNRPAPGTDRAQPSVHPRARGEQAAGEDAREVKAGSSPRTRGTGGPVPHLRQVGRFIPAHAGNSVCGLSAGLMSPVHPRARGEQMAAAARATSGAGSSPRTRGTARHSRSPARPRRFIPAHAGNRPCKRAARCPAPVHPRARGEQTTASADAATLTGSSPRTRGTAPDAYRARQRVRFIPAHAGNRRRA